MKTRISPLRVSRCVCVCGLAACLIGALALTVAVADVQAEGVENRKVIDALLASGVRLELCAQTMEANGWTASDVSPGIVIVMGAYPRIIDLQQRGYAYIRF